MPDIWFPYLGIEIDHLSKVAFSIGNFTIAWYGIMIALGVVGGLLLARHLAKKAGEDPDVLIDFLIYALIFGLIGARAYFCIFQWDALYKNNPLGVFDFRSGGLAIYGGVIAAVIVAAVFCKVKKINVLQLLDVCVPGLAVGQAIGRWGNFFNQECFGGYTDSIFAMRLNVHTAAYTTTELTQQAISKGGTTYIQVHPTFLYESVGCLLLVAIMVFLFKRRKFKGEITFTYMIGYGILRAFIENLRTDQLLIWNTQFPVSVGVSIILAIAGVILMFIFARKAKIAKLKAEGKIKAAAPTLDDEEEDNEEAEDASEEETEEEEAKDADEAEETEVSDETEAEAEEAAEEKKDEKEEKPTEEDLWG